MTTETLDAIREMRHWHRHYCEKADQIRQFIADDWAELFRLQTTAPHLKETVSDLVASIARLREQLPKVEARADSFLQAAVELEE